MPAKITVIGSANIDYVIQLPSLPRVGETVTGGRFTQTFGGKGANQAVAAARAGGEVTLVAALGNDAAAEAYRQSLADDGLNIEYVTVEPDLPGGAALIMVDDNGDNYLAVAPGANERVTPRRVREAEPAIAGCDWVVLQQEIPAAANREVLRLAAHHSRHVMLNYAPAHNRELVPDDKIDTLVVNEHEAGALLEERVVPAEHSRCDEQAEALRKRGGHRLVVITLGESGVSYRDADGGGHVPAFKAEAVDTTAAGDTFCGCLAVALGEDQPVVEAIRFAAAAAALAVSQVGAQPSIPQRSEILAMLTQT